MESHARSHWTGSRMLAVPHNFCRIHQTLGFTPAMEAGVTDRHWEVSDMVNLVEDAAPTPKKPGHAKGTKSQPRKSN